MENTSQLALFRLRDSGKLGHRQQATYEALIRIGPSTAQEVVFKARIPGAWKRLSELERAGFVRVIGVRTCEMTGEQAKVWEALR